MTTRVVGMAQSVFLSGQGLPGPLVESTLFALGGVEGVLRLLLRDVGGTFTKIK
jgi:hypothetical protein